MPPASPAPGWSRGLVCPDGVPPRRGTAERGRRRAATCDLPASLQGAGRHPLDIAVCNSARMGRMPGPSAQSPSAPAGAPGAGRTAVVTGASSGIGAATARRLAGEGFDLVLGARRMDRLTALAEEIGGRALPLDLTDPASVAEFVGALDRVDVLVNNAGGAFDAR